MLANAANTGASGFDERYGYDGFGRELPGNTPQGGALFTIGPPVTLSVNAFRFSTKQIDLETGLSYYGYRYYDANSGRWINRDPLQEQGGLNVYAYVANAVIRLFDKLGLDPFNGDFRATR